MEQELEKLNAVMEQITKEQIGREGDCRAIRKDLEGFQEKLRILEEGFVVNEAILAEVRRIWKSRRKIPTAESRMKGCQSLPDRRSRPQTRE